MGAVHEEQVNEGRGCQEWRVMPLSETHIIEKLITGRSKFDETYYALEWESNSPDISNGTPVFSELVIITYLDLERLIKKCNFNLMQSFIVKYLMLGYSKAEIADFLKKDRFNIADQVTNICARIKEQNDLEYADFLETSGLVKIDDNVKYKKCSKCGEFKAEKIDNFYADSRISSGFRSVCRKCT